MKEPITTENLRIILRVLGADGKNIVVSQLYEPLGLHEPNDRRDLREMLRNMLRYGEVKRISEGVYQYIEGYQPRERTALARVWSFVRKERPGWRLSQVGIMTGVGMGVVREYCKWLEEQGYIEVMGRDGQTRLFRGTDKADKKPETPNPPIRLPCPFDQEKKAALRVTSLMLRGNLYNPKTAAEIMVAAKVLLTRFEPLAAKSVTTNENPTTHTEEPSW